MSNNEIDGSLRIADLISRQKQGLLSPKERNELDKLLAEDPSLRSMMGTFEDQKVVYSELELMNSFNPELRLSDYHKQYFPDHKNWRLWPRIAIAAAVATMVFGAGLFFYNQQQKNGFSNGSAFNKVSPGKQGATLTLSNGKTIHLTDSNNKVLANEAGVVISKSSNGELIYEVKSATEGSKINTLSTARGETYRLRLPDGSSVWLNAASSLTYASTLYEQGKRRVKLDGEGYFEITEDKAHPFIVESRGQEVQVLGTHFNVEAYREEPIIKTTLLEGSVKVSLESGVSRTISPGQQVRLFNGSISVEEVDTELSVAWKNNLFLFEDQDLGSIMRMISRWYNVEVKYTDDVMQEKFGGGLSRFDQVSKVLKSLEETGQVHFKLQDRTIYVSRAQAATKNHFPGQQSKH